MDTWRKAYTGLGFSVLDQRWERFLFYGATAAFWIHLATWLLTRGELIPWVNGPEEWLTLFMLAIPGNARLVFLIALGPNPRREWTTTWLNPRTNPLNREQERHYRGRSRKTPKALKPTGSTLVKILAGLTMFAVCGGYWITGGNFIESSDSTTSPPRLRNEEEKRYMLDLINEARTKADAPSVVMGTNNVAQIQADQLLEDCVLSHWGTDGLKPYMRYSLAGGYQANGENALTFNECGLLDTRLQWNDDPTEMVRESVEGWLDSSGHRETMLNPSYRTVNIGLAWDKNTFKAVQHFEGDYVEFGKFPAIHDGELTLEGNLKSGYEFDGIVPLAALLIYDQKPRSLTQGQLAQTSCYSHGEAIAVVIPPSPFLKDDYEYTETVEEPQCVDPYTLGRVAEKAESRDQMTRLWKEAKEKSERVRETEVSLRFRKAEEMTARGDKFAITADVSDLLEEYGPGVYTVVLVADMENGDEIISEYSIFHEVRPPRTYSGRP